jgi:hypothetical protein
MHDPTVLLLPLEKDRGLEVIVRGQRAVGQGECTL